MSDEKTGLELKKVIEQLRKELGELAATAGGEKLQFKVDSVEVELKVGVKNEGGVNGKAKFWVLELGADAKHAAEQTQTIKLKLTPKHRGSKGEDVLVSSDD